MRFAVSRERDCLLSPVKQTVVSLRGSALLLSLASLAGCASTATAPRYPSVASLSQVDPRYGVRPSPRVVADGEEVPKGGGSYMVGKPYRIAGLTYVPSERPYTATGTASWYGSDFHGRRTANGEVFDRDSISAAHPTMPLPSYARVTNMKNSRSIIVRVNDRGPYHGGRVMDVSQRVAEALDFRSVGMARVKVEWVGKANLAGDDDAKLLATLRDDGEPAQIDGGAPVMVAARQEPVRTAALADRAQEDNSPATQPVVGEVEMMAYAASETGAAVAAPSQAASVEDEKGESSAAASPSGSTKSFRAPPLPPVRPDFGSSHAAAPKPPMRRAAN
jgi:rare lipoprotein A